jgi:preprotein translocase subunit SecY
MKQLSGFLAALAAYLLIWFISTVLPVSFSWTFIILIMVLSFTFSYYYCEYWEKGPEWLNNELKKQN